MSGWQRLAGVWGALFPVAALILFAVFTGFGERGTGADTAPGQTSGASQTTAQSGGTTSGGGSGGAMNSSAAGTAMTGSTQTTTASTPSTSASGSATTSGSATATQGSPQGTAAQATGSASPSTSTTATGSTATNSAATGGTAATTATTPSSTTARGGSTANNPQGGTPATTQATAAAKSTPEGAQVYSTNCQSCHGPAGAGVAGAFPPLAGNKAILGSEKYVSDVLLYGLQGQIAVNGQTYNGVMPAWAATLSDAQIAAVLDHVRSSWGNSASAVSEATVKTERATPLTTAQVLAERPQ